LFFALGPGCAGGGGTGTGNPGITIASRGYNTALARNSILDFAIPSAVASTTSITSLKFCVTELKFLTTNGSLISVPSTNLGLIDLGDGSAPVTWGTVKVSEGTVIDRVFVELEHDQVLCPGTNYSVEANGQDVSTELEFRFALTTPFTVPLSGSVTFSLTTLVSKIDQALQDGKFNNGHIGEYINGSFEDPAIGTDD
jgi:hypothetical protein